jgi:hypothetical protein
MNGTIHRRKTVTQSSTMSQNNTEHWIHNRENSPYPVSKPCVNAEYGTVSLSDKFPMSRDSIVLSKRDASITKWRDDTSVKRGNFDCATVKVWKLVISLFLCNVLHLTLTSFHLDPSVPFRTSLSPTLKTFSSLSMTDRQFQLWGDL